MVPVALTMPRCAEQKQQRDKEINDNEQERKDKAKHGESCQGNLGKGEN